MFKTKLRNNKLPTSVGGENSDTAVLFIHGLGGKVNTWLDFASHLKIKWNSVDTFSLEYDEYYGLQNWVHRVYFLRKCAMIFKIMFGADITDLAQHLKTVIEEGCREYDNIIIVGHSMGGLIARKYIVDKLKHDKKLDKVKGLITYATPHHGSSLASAVSFSMDMLPINFIKSKQVYDLVKNSDFINNLNSDWSKFKVEDRIDFIRVVGLEDNIVDIESSSFKNDRQVKKIANKNHFNIIKPITDRKDLAFLITFNYLKDFRRKLDLKLEAESEIETED